MALLSKGYSRLSQHIGMSCAFPRRKSLRSKEG